MDEDPTMDAQGWRNWANWALSARKSVKWVNMTCFGGPWGTHTDTLEVRALYGYFIAEYKTA